MWKSIHVKQHRVIKGYNRIRIYVWQLLWVFLIWVIHLRLKQIMDYCGKLQWLHIIFRNPYVWEGYSLKLLNKQLMQWCVSCKMTMPCTLSPALPCGPFLWRGKEAVVCCRWGGGLQKGTKSTDSHAEEFPLPSARVLPVKGLGEEGNG